jgi:acyl carrier protein
VSRAQSREQLLGFLETIRRPEHPLDDVADQENLVEVGLIDSLALLEIISFLESGFGMDFSETGVDPGQLASIAAILDLIGERKA